MTQFPLLERFRGMEPLDNLFGDLLNTRNDLRFDWRPMVDVKETDKEMIFTADLPGVNEEDVLVEVVGDMLTIRGDRKTEHVEEHENYVRRERQFGSFRRSFMLPGPITPKDVKATFKNGMLVITVPKAISETATRVEIIKP